jgi:DNA polymerase III psi subunit
MQLVERAVSSLSPETIRPVYRILSAIGSTYLDIMSIDVITRLQSLLNEVLRKTKVDEDQYENLLCLAILAKFASRPRDNSCTKKDPSKGMQPPTVTALSVPTDVFASARKYFANCAYKTFDLITMKASKNCSQSCALSLSDVLESLKLSEEIVDACDPIERKQWIAKSSSKVKTLQKKILRQDIGSETQCAVGDRIF